jgi:1-deoxy-D-xylulose-5-phosphate synthase
MIELGKGETVLRAQNTEHRAQIVIIAIGSMVQPAVEAAKKMGNATIVNARFVKPLDKKLILNAVKNAKQVVTIEEGVVEGGFGSAVLELLAAEGIDIPVKCLGLPSKFIEQGKRDELLDMYGLTAEKIAQLLYKH